MNIYITAPDIKCLILHENGEIYFVPTEYSIKVEGASYTIIAEKTYLLLSAVDLYCKFADYEKDALHFYKIYFEQSHVLSLKNIKNYSNILDQLYSMSYDLKDTNIIKFELEKYENDFFSKYKSDFQKIKECFIGNKSKLQKGIDNLNYAPIIIDDEDFLFSSLSSKSSKEPLINESSHNNSQQCNSPQSTITVLSDQSILNEHHEKVAHSNINISDQNKPCLILHNDGEIYFVPEKYIRFIKEKNQHLTRIEESYYLVMSINDLRRKIIYYPNGNINTFYTSYFEKSENVARIVKIKWNVNIAMLLSNTQDIQSNLKIFSLENIFGKNSIHFDKFKKIKETYSDNQLKLLNKKSESSSFSLSTARKKYLTAYISAVADMDKIDVQENSNYIDLSLDNNDCDDVDKNVYDFNFNNASNSSQVSSYNDFSVSKTYNDSQLNSLELVDFMQDPNLVNNSNNILTNAPDYLQNNIVFDDFSDNLQINKNTNSSSSFKSITTNSYNKQPDLNCVIIHENGDIYYIPQEYMVREYTDMPYTIIDKKTYKVLSITNLYNLLRARRVVLINFYKEYFKNCSLKNIIKTAKVLQELDNIYDKNYDLESPNIIKFDFDKSGVNIYNQKDKFSRIKEAYISNQSSLQKEIENLVYQPFYSFKEVKSIEDWNLPCLILHEDGNLYFVPHIYAMKLNGINYTIIDEKIYILHSLNEIKNNSDSPCLDRYSNREQIINSNIVQQDLFIKKPCFEKNIKRFVTENINLRRAFSQNFKTIQEIDIKKSEYLKNHLKATSSYTLLDNENDISDTVNTLPTTSHKNLTSQQNNNYDYSLFPDYLQESTNKTNLTFAYDASRNDDLDDLYVSAVNALDEKDIQEQSSSNSKRMR